MYGPKYEPTPYFDDVETILADKAILGCPTSVPG
jgi:hypothetical protein